MFGNISLCIMYYVLCIMHYALCIMRFEPVRKISGRFREYGIKIIAVKIIATV